MKRRNPRLIIFGGSGLIGSALALSQASRYRVTVVTRPSSRFNPKDSRIEVVPWDYREHETILSLMAGKYLLVNLVGENLAGRRWNRKKKAAILSSRLFLPGILTGILPKARTLPLAYLQASAIGFYPNHSELSQVEEALPGRGFLSRVTAEWEAAAGPIDMMGVRTLLFRFGLVLSREGGILPRLWLPYRFFMGAGLGSGREWISWIHISDLIRAVEFLIAREEKKGIYNLTSPEPVRSGEFYRTLARTIKRPLWFRVPGFALRPVLGEMADETLLSSRKVIPCGLMKSGFKFRHPHLEDALHDLLIPSPG